MTLLEQMQSSASQSVSSARVMHWFVSKEVKGLECKIKGVRFVVVELSPKGRALGAMFIAGKCTSHETSNLRTAKEWAWRQAHSLGLLPSVKSVKVTKKVKAA